MRSASTTFSDPAEGLEALGEQRQRRRGAFVGREAHEPGP
jgi:hypothetical protein